MPETLARRISIKITARQIRNDRILIPSARVMSRCDNGARIAHFVKINRIFDSESFLRALLREERYPRTFASSKIKLAESATRRRDS